MTKPRHTYSRLCRLRIKEASNTHTQIVCEHAHIFAMCSKSLKSNLPLQWDTTAPRWSRFLANQYLLTVRIHLFFLNMSCLTLRRGIHTRTEQLGIWEAQPPFWGLGGCRLTAWLSISGHDSVRYGPLELTHSPPAALVQLRHDRTFCCIQVLWISDMKQPGPYVCIGPKKCASQKLITAANHERRLFPSKLCRLRLVFPSQQTRDKLTHEWLSMFPTVCLKEARTHRFDISQSKQSVVFDQTNRSLRHPMQSECVKGALRQMYLLL